MRWAAIAVCLTLVGCNKKEPEAEAVETPAAPSVGHSKTKVVAADDPGSEPSGDHGTAAEVPGDAGETADGPLYGGNGQPAQRDASGRVRGPGGPVYMGRGPDCNHERNHCLRDGVWFAAGNVTPGKLYRATPVFELEGAWWTFRDKEHTDWQVVYETKVVDNASELTPGSPVVWLVEAGSSQKWLTSEYDALTSSRWEVGTIDKVSGSTFTVLGWAKPVPIDTARVILQQKKPS